MLRNHATGADGAQLTFDLSPMVMDLDRAVLTGLILNESISNALKHGFPDRRSRAIRVGLHETRGGFGRQHRKWKKADAEHGDGANK